MKSVLISVKPDCCRLIAEGKKTIEVRKSRPKIETPFKVYIYCTKSGTFMVKNPNNPAHSKNRINKYGGKVIGEFVCDYINESHIDDYDFGKYDFSDDELKETGIPYEDIWLYSNGNTLYLWHISDLVIYETPLPLEAFKYQCCGDCEDCKYSHYESRSRYYYDEPVLTCDNTMKRPPQSWCYVEVLE